MNRRRMSIREYVDIPVRLRIGIKGKKEYFKDRTAHEVKKVDKYYDPQLVVEYSKIDVCVN